MSVAFGVAVATAVIVGALLVGDSMRGSLRQLTIERLGNTEVVIFPGGFFSAENITSDAIDPVALILFDSAVVETRRDDGTTEAHRGGHRTRGRHLLQPPHSSPPAAPPNSCPPHCPRSASAHDDRQRPRNQRIGGTRPVARLSSLVMRTSVAAAAPPSQQAYPGSPHIYTTTRGTKSTPMNTSPC